MQQAAEETGSAVAPPPDVQPDAWAVAVAEPDAWAEAFAESARLGAVSPPPPPPHYPVIINAQVQRFIEHYTVDRREVVGMWLSRSQRYLGMIREVLRAQGLPEELAFVAMIESGYNPLAVSRAGAKGLWQFMAGTARRYGLRVDQWVDERFDPEKSTAAAAAYLRDLHRQFGSWVLAKAAYNAGEMKVIRAIRALGTTDFWTLAGSRFLKQETKEFVPAIHAATVIGRDPTRFGFEPTEPPALAFETLTVPAATNLRALALASGLPADAIRDLNPVLVRGITPPGGGPYRLKIPVGSAVRVGAVLQPKPASARGRKGAVPVTGASVHVVRANETLGGIALRYGVSVADLVRWNDLDDPGLIRPGDRLRIAGPRLTAGAKRSR
ncbi:MAG: transglycosylase SLT domain-containing protein [Candidatus Rokuibacteriota bacterium]